MCIMGDLHFPNDTPCKERYALLRRAYGCNCALSQLPEARGKRIFRRGGKESRRKRRKGGESHTSAPPPVYHHGSPSGPAQRPWQSLLCTPLSTTISVIPLPILESYHGSHRFALTMVVTPPVHPLRTTMGDSQSQRMHTPAYHHGSQAVTPCE